MKEQKHFQEMKLKSYTGNPFSDTVPFLCEGLSRTHQPHLVPVPEQALHRGHKACRVRGGWGLRAHGNSEDTRCTPSSHGKKEITHPNFTHCAQKKNQSPRFSSSQQLPCELRAFLPSPISTAPVGSVPKRPAAQKFCILSRLRNTPTQKRGFKTCHAFTTGNWRSIHF